MKLFPTPAVLAAWFFIVGCSTPPGKLTQRDFVSKTVTFPKPLSEVLSNFYEGLRYCGADYSVPECSPPRPNGEVTCDLYLVGAYGAARSNFVLGRADFTPTTEGGTFVKFGVIRTYGVLIGGAAAKEKVLSGWERLAAGNAKQVCP